jgi:uncharacterized iron-regulated membrane protein
VQVPRRDGKLVIVAAVERLHPRHWDGHRLLQFLTGVALLVLAFGTAAASASPVTTTVEAPAAAPAAGRDRAAPADRHSGECQHDASRAGRAVPAAQDDAVAADSAAPAAAVPAGAVAAQAAADGPAQSAAEAPADVPAAAAPKGAPIRAAVERPAAGIAQQAHGSRAPPR